MKTPSLIARLAGLSLALTLPLAAQQKISDRASLSASDLNPATDIFGIVDVSAGAAGSKKITVNETFDGWGFTTAGKAIAMGVNAAAQRGSLGLVVGTNVQAWDADLDSWAAKTAPSGTVLGTSDTQTVTNKTLTSPVINVTSDATGDIYYRSAGGAFTRLGIGSTGQVLKVASGLPSWAAAGGGGDLVSTNNLSDLANASTARSNLGLAIGSNVQAWDADLDSWAAKTAPSGTVLGTSDTQTVTNKTLTSPVINVTSDATGDIYYRSAGGVFTRLGIGSTGDVLKVASGLPSWAAAPGGGDLVSTNNLSDLANASTARTNLGLAIGSNVQAWDADLDSWAAKTAPSGVVLGTSDTQTVTNKTLTSPVINVTSDATGDVYYRNSGGAFTRLGIGSTGQVLTVASGLPSWAAAGGGGLTNFTEAVNTSSPNATVPAVSLTATNAATNVDFVVQPKGSGAIIAQVPDGTGTAGNKRGANAVDFQRVRAVNTQVASGTGAVISGGYRNTAATGTNPTVVGGFANIASGDYSVAGGYTNTASGGGSTAFGDTTIASGQASTSAGNNTTASGNFSTAMGQYSVASGTNSTAIGFRADTRSLFGAFAQSSGLFSASGDAQASSLIMRAATTNGTQTELFLDNSSARLVLPNNSTYSFTGQLTSRSSTGDAAAWRFSGTVERGANAAATALVGSVIMTDTNAEAGASTWALAIDADTSNGSLRLRVTGVAATNIRWVAQIETTEVIY